MSYIASSAMAGFVDVTSVGNLLQGTSATA
ncbi:Uncharacterised protein [Tatumella ptyseos]|uniref:Uncharacterized protein n=1 Tax=Tatumella ptyseos TaxID=82987 RepID=A0A2X5NFK4_9GAMM|nr:Uncharacterised protein [Tatumella ptyseos]